MDSLVASGMSDTNSPTSPLQEAGDDTEANLDLFQSAGDFNEATGDYGGSQLQEESHLLRGIPRLHDVPGDLQEQPKRRKSDGVVENAWTGLGLGSLQRAQLAFSATVDSIADECNVKLDACNRLDFQIGDAVLKLQRKESLKMPWDEVPSKQLWRHAKPADLFKLPLLGRFDNPHSILLLRWLRVNSPNVPVTGLLQARGCWRQSLLKLTMHCWQGP